MADWYTPKRYLHFDYPLSETQEEETYQYVSSPEKIATHSFYPFLRFSITKYKTEENLDGTRHYNDADKRYLSYAAHKDSMVYSYYAHLLSTKYEEKLTKYNLEKNIIAFRKIPVPLANHNKCNTHFANDAFEKILELGECTAFAFDIRKFFDSLKPEHLKKSWERILNVTRLPNDHFNVYKSLAQHAYIDKEKVYEILKIPKRPSRKEYKRICSPETFRNVVRKHEYIDSSGNSLKCIFVNKEGIPQGSPISALLANIYMLEVDKQIKTWLSTISSNSMYYRYCDDILIIIPKCTLKKDEASATIQNFLTQVGLELHPDKTQESIFSHNLNNKLICDHPLQYLGYVFDGQRKYIRTSSISRYRRKAKRAVSLAKQTQRKYNRIRVKNGEKERPLFKKKLYRRYYYIGKRSFISYGHRSAGIMNSPTIRKQIKKMNSFFIDELNRY